jgi:hypothetical protein
MWGTLADLQFLCLANHREMAWEEFGHFINPLFNDSLVDIIARHYELSFGVAQLSAHKDKARESWSHSMLAG